MFLLEEIRFLASGFPSVIIPRPPRVRLTSLSLEIFEQLFCFVVLFSFPFPSFFCCCSVVFMLSLEKGSLRVTLDCRPLVLSLLLLVVVILVYICSFLSEPLNLQINVFTPFSMFARHLPPFFLDCLLVLSPCALLSIFLTSSPFDSDLPQSISGMTWRSYFLSSDGRFFFYYYFISTCLMVSTIWIPKYL